MVATISVGKVQFSSVQFSLGPICLNPELFKGLDPLSQSRWK